MLLERVIGEAWKMGMTRLQLLADFDNEKALDFYRHLGWSTGRMINMKYWPQLQLPPNDPD